MFFIVPVLPDGAVIPFMIELIVFLGYFYTNNEKE